MGKVTEGVVAKPVAANNAKKGGPAKRKGQQKEKKLEQTKNELIPTKKRGKKGKKMDAAMRSLRNRALLAPPPRRIVTKDISN